MLGERGYGGGSTTRMFRRKGGVRKSSYSSSVIDVGSERRALAAGTRVGIMLNGSLVENKSQRLGLRRMCVGDLNSSAAEPRRRGSSYEFFA